MGFRETIEVLLKVDSNGAVSGIKSFRQSVADADGVTGKFKAAAGGAFEYAKQHAVAMGVTAGAAVGAFALKAVDDFKDLGLEVGQFRDSTGLAADEASRWIEVAGDLGISSDDLEGAIGRFNKTIGLSPGVLQQFGVDLVKGKGGVTDVNATFLNAIETIKGIEDPAKKAEAGARLFGKGWQSMSELIARGSGQLRTDLAVVDESKIFDDKKVDDARRLREGFDTVKDAAEKLFLTVGSSLAPVIADLAPKIGEIVEKAAPLAEELGTTLAEGLEASMPLLEAMVEIAVPLAEGLGLVVQAVKDMGESMLGGVAQNKDYQEALKKARDAQKDLADKAEYYKSRVDAAREATLQAGEAFDDTGAKAEYYRSRVEAAGDETLALRDAYKELMGELSNEEAWLGVEEAVDNYKAKIDEAGASNREKRQALIDMKQKLIEYLAALEGVPVEKQTEILALIDQAKIDEAEAALAQLSRPRNVPVSVMTGGQLPTIPRFDSGGVMPGPIGQHNLALVAGGETILPTHKGPVGVGGGVIQIQTNWDERRLIQTLRQYQKRGGRL